MFPLGFAVAVLGQLLGNVELYQGVSFQCMRVCSPNCLLLTGILLSVNNHNHRPGLKSQDEAQCWVIFCSVLKMQTVLELSIIQNDSTNLLFSIWNLKIHMSLKDKYQDFPGGAIYQSACQCRGHGFNPWFGKIPQAEEQLSQRTTATEVRGLPKACALQQEKPMHHHWRVAPTLHS